MTTRVVVVGAGTAAGRLAGELVAGDPDRRLDITLVGDEPHPPYWRALLTSVLAGDAHLGGTAAHPRDWYRQCGVRLLLGRRVRSLDLAARRVVLDGESALPYDRLVLATGGEQVLPGDTRPGRRRRPAAAHPRRLRAAAASRRRRALGGRHRRRTARRRDRTGAGPARPRGDDRAPRAAPAVPPCPGGRRAGPRSQHDPPRRPGAHRRAGHRAAAQAGPAARPGGRRARSRRPGRARLRFPSVDGPRRHRRAAGRRGIVVGDDLRCAEDVWAVGACAEHAGVVDDSAVAAEEQAAVAARAILGEPARYPGCRPTVAAARPRPGSRGVRPPASATHTAGTGAPTRTSSRSATRCGARSPGWRSRQAGCARASSSVTSARPRRSSPPTTATCRPRRAGARCCSAVQQARDRISTSTKQATLTVAGKEARMTRRTLVVTGYGMVAHRFVEAVCERGLTTGPSGWDVRVLAEEAVPAYDRVALSSCFSGRTAAELTLLPDGAFPDPAVTVSLGEQVTALDPQERCLTTSAGRRLGYDSLVLATGSRPFIPPVPGHDAPGCFVYRTLDDVAAIRAAAAGRQTGIVVGGGLLGLEAAHALLSLGLATTVVELAPRLMALQVDDGGGAQLRRHIERLGVQVRAGTATGRIITGPDGAVTGVELTDGTCARRRRRGVRGRRAAAGRAGARRGPRRRRARRCPGGRSLPDVRRGDLCDRRMRGCWRAGIRAGGARLCDGRGRRRPAGRRRGDVHHRRHLHQAQAARGGRGQLRRRVRHDRRRARARLLRLGRGRLQEAGRHRRRQAAARRDARRRRLRLRRAAPARGQRPAASRRPGCLDPALGAARRPRRPAARRGPRVQLQQRHGGLHPRLGALAGMRDRRRGQDLHQGGHRLRQLRPAGQVARRRRAVGSRA